jgi:CBS domain containing-hemolysin-like protein
MIYIYLSGCLFFIILQGFFAAMEISVISSSPLKLRHRQVKGDRKAAKVYQLYLQPERFLATTLVGINLSLILSSSFLTFLLIHMGVHKSNVWTMIFFTPLVVIFGELVPKNIGRYFKEDFNCSLISIFTFFEKLLSPVVNNIESVSKFLVSVFIGKVRKRSLFVTKEEITYLVKEAEREGKIDRGEKKAIEGVLEFRDKRVKDVCMRLNKLVTLDYLDSQANVLEKVKKGLFTRYPVFKDKEIIGYVNIYDVFYNHDNSWLSLIRPIAMMDANQNLYDALIALKAKKENIALVLEGKKAYGMITLQDLVREIINSVIQI